MSMSALAFSWPVRVPRLSSRGAFLLEASLVVSFLAGSSAPTPLYGVYQAAWGFSPVTITVIFGVYALGVLASLLTLGSLSDYVGRRPVLLVTTALQALTMLLFARADGVPALLFARVLQGVSTGAAIAAVGAGMLDIDRARGTIANAVGPMLGTATGGLLSGLSVQYLPAPPHLVYLVLFAVFVAQGAGLTLIPESVRAKAGALGSLRPHFRLPARVRQPLGLAAPAIIAAWALAGFYASLGPSLLRSTLGSSSLALGGLALFVLAASGAGITLLMRRRSAFALLSLGTALLAAGVALTLVAVGERSALGFFAGTSLAGMGFGAAFQGAIRTVVPLASPDERAGVLSVLYLISYAAMGVPAVLAGFRIVHGASVAGAAREYGAVVILLALTALVGALYRRLREAPSATRSMS